MHLDIDNATASDAANYFTLSVPSLIHSTTGDITLSAGTVPQPSDHKAPAMWVKEPLWKGLKLTLVLSGRLDCRVDGYDPLAIEGPMLCAVANEGDHCGDHLFSHDQPVRYTSVQLDFAAIEQAGLPPEQLLPYHDQHPVMFCQRAPRALQALARQIMTCPLQGPTRSFYLSAKALELTALGIEGLLHPSDAHETPPQRGLSSSDLERIHAARDLMCGDLQEVHSLAALARQVGLNTRKLNEGFRQAFGTSVHAYRQEMRLQEAYRLLASGEINVSSAAYRVGYSPAHFSIAFRKRFGLSPSALR